MKPEAKQVHLVGVAAAKSVEFGDAFVTINDIVAIALARALARLPLAPDLPKHRAVGLLFLSAPMLADGLLSCIATRFLSFCTVPSLTFLCVG